MTDKLISDSTYDWIQHIQEEFGVPGMAVGIVRAGPNNGPAKAQILTLGKADEAGNPVTARTTFAPGEPKSLTAFALGLLIDRQTKLGNGQVLNWSTKIKDVIPGWDLMDKEAAEKITLEDLLVHRGGIPAHNFAITREGPEAIVERFKHLRPSQPLGNKWQYNNHAYGVIGRAIELVTGEALTSFLQRELLAPLDMTETYFDLHKAKASAFQFPGNREQGQSTGWYDEGDGKYHASFAGPVMSANDQVKWLAELLNPKIIPQHIIDKFLTPQIQTFKSQHTALPDEHYGPAHRLSTYRNHKVTYYLGANPCIRTINFRVPSEGIAVSTMANTKDPDWQIGTTICLRVLDDLLGLAPVDREIDLRKFIEGHATTEHPTIDGKTISSCSAGYLQSKIGKYHDKGYDTITLVPVDTTNPAHQSILSYFSLPTSSAANLLIAEIDNRHIISHCLLTPLYPNNDLFKWYAVFLTANHCVNPQGSGEVVVMNQGMGMFGGWQEFLDWAPGNVMNLIPATLIRQPLNQPP